MAVTVTERGSTLEIHESPDVVVVETPAKSAVEVSLVDNPKPPVVVEILSGAQGLKGDKGDIGPEGPQGIQGPKGDKGDLSNGDVIMNTNPFGGKHLYINSINNAMYKADKRFTVTGSLYSKATNALVGTIGSGTLAALFDGNYESNVIVPKGQYAVVTVDFGGPWSGYPYGDLFISHYYNSYTESVAVRVYYLYAPQGGPAWYSIPVTDFLNNTNQLIRKANNQKYQTTKFEFTFTAGEDIDAKVTQVEWNLERPGSNDMPLVDKYKANTIYYDLEFGAYGPAPIIRSPDGSRWRIQVDNAGVLSTVKVA